MHAHVLEGPPSGFPSPGELLAVPATNTAATVTTSAHHVCTHAAPTGDHVGLDLHVLSEAEESDHIDRSMPPPALPSTPVHRPRVDVVMATGPIAHRTAATDQPHVDNCVLEAFISSIKTSVRTPLAKAPEVRDAGRPTKATHA